MLIARCSVRELALIDQARPVPDMGVDNHADIQPITRSL